MYVLLMCVHPHKRQQNCVQEKIEFVIENRSCEPKPLMVSINEIEIRKAYYQKRLRQNVVVPVSSYDSPQFTALNRKCGTEASL